MEPARKTPASERSLTHSPYSQVLPCERMSEGLNLTSMTKRTHEGYLRAVRTMADFCQKSEGGVITAGGTRRTFRKRFRTRHKALAWEHFPFRPSIWGAAQTATQPGSSFFPATRAS